jgi:heat shock protein 1/8
MSSFIIDSIQNEDSSSEEEKEWILPVPNNIENVQDEKKDTIQDVEKLNKYKEDEQDKEDKEDDEDEIDSYFGSTTKSKNNEPKEEPKKEEVEEEIIVGIDLGTTNSCIGVWRKKNLEIIPDKYGNRTIPSAVAFTSKSRYVGKEAKKQIELNPDNTFYEVKRLIGRKYDDDTVINDKEFLTYQIDKDKKDNVILKTNLTNHKNSYTPEELSSILLMELKHMAEDYLKQPVKKAVITVPAYFNDAQRQATKDAAEIAGLECMRIINEPTAAALAYGLEKASYTKSGEDLTVIVYDLGGGTLDCSLLNIADGCFHVLGSSGNTHLGGADFDNRLINFAMNEFKKKYRYSKLKDLSSMSFQKLKQSCEAAKKRLSETTKTVIAVKDFYDGKNLLITITRELFQKVCRDLLIMCLKSIDDVLKSCDIERDEVDEIILVGGSTRMPTIKEHLKLFFNGKEPNSSVNPDEVVAAGAAIQAYILSHESDPFSENVVLLDIIPLSLGVETIGGVMNVLIPRNSIIPIKRKRKYTTDSDNETSVKVKVYEGERKLTKDNFMVGEFTLTGIDEGPRGYAQIEITFAVDINGIISVTAQDLRNVDNKKTININSNKGRLTAEEIKELILEAKNFEIKDKIEKEKKQLYYEIEDLCSNIKTNICDENFKLKEKDKLMIAEDIKKIYEWLEEKNYMDRTKKEYLKVLKKIKNKYGTLIIRSTGENDKVTGLKDDKTNITTTTVYGDDEEDNETIYEELENEELGLDKEDDETKKEIKRLRETVVELCYTIFNIISCDTLKIEKDHVIELKEYVDDILLWVHVAEKIKISEYKQKIDEVNKSCNDIVEKYNDSDIFETEAVNTFSKRNELEQLCYTLLSGIVSNILALHEDNIKKLKEKVEEYLDWLLLIDVKIKKAEIDNKTYKLDEQDYQIRIDSLNTLCDELYNSMLNVNIKNTSVIIPENKNLEDDNTKELEQLNALLSGTEKVGTSIFDLKNKNKN